MKKISLKNLNLKEVKQLSRKELKEVFAGYSGSGEDCGPNATYNALLSTCLCNEGYYFSFPFGQCVEGTGSGGEDPNPKITACIGKDEYDECSYTWQGVTYGPSGHKCRYRFGYFSCSNTIFT